MCREPTIVVVVVVVVVVVGFRSWLNGEVWNKEKFLGRENEIR